MYSHGASVSTSRDQELIGERIYIRQALRASLPYVENPSGDWGLVSPGQAAPQYEISTQVSLGNRMEIVQ
jgi:hypothetical protein